MIETCRRSFEHASSPHGSSRRGSSRHGVPHPGHHPVLASPGCGGKGRVLPAGKAAEYPDSAGHVHRARGVRPGDVRDSPEDAEPGHPCQHRVRGAAYRQRFRGTRLRRGQPRHPTDQAGQQGVPGGCPLRNLGARAVQPAARRGGRVPAHSTAGLRHHPRGQGRRAHHRHHRHPGERGAGRLRAGPDAPVPHAHGRPATLLRSVGEGLSGEHRHSLLPDLGARPGGPVQTRRGRREAHHLAGLHFSYQPAPAPEHPCARGVTGTSAWLLRRDLRATTAPRSMAKSAAATSSASGWRRKTSTPRCPSR